MLARGETIGEPYPCIRRFCACRRLLASTVENSRARTIGWLDKIANIMCQTWNSGITRRLAKKKKKIVFFEGEEKKERRIFLYLYPLFKKRKKKEKEKAFRRDFKINYRLLSILREIYKIFFKFRDLRSR